MKRLAAAFVSALLCSSITFAATCEEMAVSKEGKPLHGAAKAASIKKCMKDNPAATPATPATPAEPAAKAPSEAKTAQQAKMKQCNTDATGKKGAERKALMKECQSK